MKQTEILHLIRHDLQGAVARSAEAADPSTDGRLALVGDERLAEGHPPGA